MPGWLRPHILKHGRDAEAQDQDFALSAFESDCEIVTKSYASPFQSAAKLGGKTRPQPQLTGHLGLAQLTGHLGANGHQGFPRLSPRLSLDSWTSL